MYGDALSKVANAHSTVDLPFSLLLLGLPRYYSHSSQALIAGLVINASVVTSTFVGGGDEKKSGAVSRMKVTLSFTRRHVHPRLFFATFVLPKVFEYNGCSTNPVYTSAGTLQNNANARMRFSFVPRVRGF